MIPIPVISTSDIAGDTQRFYQRYARRPVIVRECYPADHPLRALDLDSIEALIGGRSIHVYGAAAGEPGSL